MNLCKSGFKLGIKDTMHCLYIHCWRATAFQGFVARLTTPFRQCCSNIRVYRKQFLWFLLSCSSKLGKPRAFLNSNLDLDDTESSFLGLCATCPVMPYSGRDIALFVVAFFFPPVAVWIRRGLCTTDFLINVCLTCLGASMYLRNSPLFLLQSNTVLPTTLPTSLHSSGNYSRILYCS